MGTQKLTRVQDLFGIRTTTEYEISDQDRLALDKVDDLIDYVGKLEPSYVDDGLRDTLSEVYLNIIKYEAVVISVKEEVIL